MPDEITVDRPKNRTPGTSYSPKRGKLYRFDRGGVQVIRGWPNPAAWTKRNDGAWKGLRPWVDLSAASEQHPPFTWTSIHELDAFRAIPQPIVQHVIGARLDRQQWASLQLAVRVPGGLALMAAVPLLGAALACSHRIKPTPVARPLRSARALLRRGPGMKTWRRVAAWLGFEGSRSLVDTLRRVVLVDDRPWPVELVLGLRTAWADPCARKRLLHAERLDLDVVKLVVGAHGHGLQDRLHPGLIQAAFNQGQVTTVPSHFHEVAGAWRVLRPERTFPRLRSAEELDTLREVLRQECEVNFQAECRKEPPVDFPAPPLRPRPGIQPLATTDELVAESLTMKNCLDLAHWAIWSRRRFGFAYAVSAGAERADVWLVPDSLAGPGNFRVQEVRGPGNGPPAQACLGMVDAWLGEHRRRLRESERPLEQVPADWRPVWAVRPLLASNYPTALAWALDDIPF